ncbi:MAG: oligosaccharide flippase family protein, partial [Candidatus Binatia bacterium]|nr:oligosaccharide flippase family protein [Candidatus Binatia bacterium]
MNSGFHFSHLPPRTTSAPIGRRLLDGTLRVFLAEALFPLTGLITAVFLTRRLGPEGYGLLTLAAALIVWAENGVAGLFSRATYKLVAEAEDWRPVGAMLVRWHLAVGCGITLLLWVCAAPLAKLFREPALTSYLWLFALDLPLFGLAHAHRNILVGVGEFRQRALVGASRWLARLVLIVLFVELGFSVHGAICGSIGASLVELLIGRVYIRPPLFSPAPFPVRQLWKYSGLVGLSALSLACYNRLDLVALKVLGGTAAQAGLYGAAQNLTVLPSIFALSFSPLLLATLTRVLRTADHHSAREISRDAMRLVVALLPFAGMTAGAAPEIVDTIFGPAFSPAAPLLA